MHVKLHKMQFPTFIFQHFELIKFLRHEWIWLGFMCTMVNVVKTGEKHFFGRPSIAHVVKMFSFLSLLPLLHEMLAISFLNIKNYDDDG